MRLAETNKKTDVDRDVKQGLSSEAPPILKSQGEEKGPVKITEKKLFFFFDKTKTSDFFEATWWGEGMIDHVKWGR